jgi:hypothetical protein
LLRFFPKPEIKKSLYTKDLKSAKTLVKVLAFETERVFTLIRSSMLTDTQIRNLVVITFKGR